MTFLNFQNASNRVHRRSVRPTILSTRFMGLMILVLLAVFCQTGDLQAATVTERWGENSNCDYTGVMTDTYIDEGQRIYNMGASTYIRVGDNDGYRPVRTLVKVDFSNLNIASEDQIISAKLHMILYQRDAKDYDGVSIYRMRRDWYAGNNDYAVADDADDEVTWDYLDYDDVWWGQGGADDSGDREFTPTDTVYINKDPMTGTWYSWDVTASAKEAFRRQEFEGWILIWNGENQGTQNKMRFASSDYDNGHPERRPYLEITYDDSAGAALAANPGSLNLFVGDDGTTTISGGTAPYSVTTTNSAVATAVIAGTTVTVTGVGEGSATIRVTDSDNNTLDVPVTVTPPLVATPDNVSLYPSQNTTVTVSGGAPGYTVVSGNDTVATAAISGDTLTINAVGTGNVTLTITDQADQHVYVTVNVGDSMTPGLGDCPVPPFTVNGVGPNVLILFDTSGSMDQDDGDGVSRFEEARESLLDFLAVNKNIRFGLMRIDGTPWVDSGRPGGVVGKHNAIKGGRLLVPTGHTGSFATSADFIINYINTYMSQGVYDWRDDTGARHWTNLAESLADAGRYFATVIDGSGNRVSKGPAGFTHYKEGTDYTYYYDTDGDSTREPYLASLHDDHGNPIDSWSPLQHSCEQAFVIMFTDGQANCDNDWDLVTDVIGDYDGDNDPRDCKRADPEVIRPGISDPNNSEYGRPLDGAVYPCDTRGNPNGDNEDGNTKYLDDVAAYLYDKDLRSDIPGKQNVITYTIGFYLSDQNLLKDTAKNGGGKHFTASSIDTLTKSLQTAIEDIMVRVASGTAVSAVTTSANTDDYMFRAKFLPGSSWRGYLERFTLPYIGGGDADWEAGALLNARVAASGYADRKIYTFMGSQIPKKQAFTSADGAVKTRMAGLWSEDNDETADIIDYLRGDTTYDGDKYKDRSGWLLGDITYSSPMTVGPPRGWYFNRDYHTDPPEYSSYQAFKSAHIDRKYVTYVGANDGMLHAFRSGDDPTADCESGGSDVGTDKCGGWEKWAFIPESIQGKLKDLTAEDCHKYFVDLTPVAADAWFGVDADDVETDGRNWKTVLIGGNRFGGEEYFVLDVTDPAYDQFEALWDVIPFAGKMSSTQPAVGKVKVNNGAVDTWATLITSGYHGGSDNGLIAALDIKNGNKLDIWINPNYVDGDDDDDDGPYLSEVETQNKTVGTSYYTMSSPTALDTDLDGYLDLIYAGDTEGSLWKFYYDYAEDGWKKVELFNTGGQAITTQPALAFDSNHKLRIYFGTGKYLEESDKANNTRNAFYCLVDELYDDGDPDTQLPNERHYTRTDSLTGQLQDLTDIITWEQYDNNLDATAQAKVTGKGWFFNLDQPAAGGDPAERVLNKALVVAGNVFFSSFFPNQDVCGFGGHARLYAINFIYGTVPDDLVLEDMVTGKRYKDTGLGIASEPVYYYDPRTRTVSIIAQTSDATVDRNDPGVDEREMELKYWKSVW